MDLDYNTIYTEVDNIEGYTPAMMSVYKRKKERQEFEYEQSLINNNNTKVSNKNSRSSTRKKLPKRAKRCESPSVHRSSSRSKSQTVVRQKKEVIHLKKVKSTQIRRAYSLRG